MARLLLTGKATRRSGSAIVRSALVTLLQTEGHTVYTSAPGHEVVDYLVTSNKSRNNRTMKYRWAEEHGVEILTYPQMWRILDNVTRIQLQAAQAIEYSDEQLATRDAQDRQEREIRAQLYQQRIYDCMGDRDLTYSAAEVWVAAEVAAGEAARAAGAEFDRVANEPLPDAQTQHASDEREALRRLMPERPQTDSGDTERELNRIMRRSEPHTIPEPGTPHNNPRVSEYQGMEGGVQREERLRRERAATRAAADIACEQVRMEKERARVRPQPPRPKPATAPRRRIHVRR